MKWGVPANIEVFYEVQKYRFFLIYANTFFTILPIQLSGILLHLCKDKSMLAVCPFREKKANKVELIGFSVC